jgi:hypothetical protein
MGASFANYHVRKIDAKNCARALTTLISSRALVTDSKNGWTTVYDEKSDSQDIEVLRRLAKGLSSKLKTAVVAMMVHDGDVFIYLLFDNGEIVDQFDSKPDYFGPVSDAKRREWAGNFSRLLRYAKKGTVLADLKHASDKKLKFDEDERASEFAKLLGIDPARASTGFKYVQETKHKLDLIYAKGYSQDQAQLVEAVSRGDAAKVKELLEKGTSPHQKDRFGQPLLVVAGRRGKLDMVRDLTAHDADLFSECPGGGDALWIASAEGHEQIVAHLLEKAKGNPKLPSSLRIAFSAAVMAGRAEVLKELILAGADVTGKNTFGQLPLLLASMRGNEFIWEAHAKKPFPHRPGDRPANWKEVVLILLEAGAQIPFPVKEGTIDVKSLSADQKSKLADSLLEAGAKIKLPEGFKFGACDPKSQSRQKDSDTED